MAAHPTVTPISDFLLFTALTGVLCGWFVPVHRHLAASFQFFACYAFYNLASF